MSEVMSCGETRNTHALIETMLKFFQLDVFLKWYIPNWIPFLYNLTSQVLSIIKYINARQKKNKIKFAYVWLSSNCNWLSRRRRSFSPDRSRSLCIFCTLLMRSERWDLSIVNVLFSSTKRPWTLYKNISISRLVSLSTDLPNLLFCSKICILVS